MIVFYVIFSLFSVLCLHCAIAEAKWASKGSCKIRIPADIPKNEPIYLTASRKGWQLAQPKNGNIFVEANKNITLFCPGTRNSITTVNRNLISATCLGLFNNWQVVSNSISLNQLNCTKQIGSVVKNSNTKCANGVGIGKIIGFQIEHKFIKLINVCYDEAKSIAIYTQHYVDGSNIKFNIRENERPGFRTTGIPLLKNINFIYKRKHQIEHFRKLFSETILYKYFNEKSFLSRGHLTPDADFLFTSQQFATYYYLNVAPQFQTINQGNWLRVETLTRKIALKANAKLLIYSGTYDVLSLKNKIQEDIPLYLAEDQRVPIPKWFWKIIINERIRTAIVLITSNNPFFEKNNGVQEICPNICQEANMNLNYFSVIEKGYTYCCELNQFRKTVNVLPDKLGRYTLMKL